MVKIAKLSIMKDESARNLSENEVNKASNFEGSSFEFRIPFVKCVCVYFLFDTNGVFMNLSAPKHPH